MSSSADAHSGCTVTNPMRSPGKAMSFESPMWDYWEYENYPHKQLPEVTELLEKAGWHSEFHDAGTVMIWKN